MFLSPIAEAAGITGRVTDTGGAPILGASVTLSVEDEIVTGTASDSYGYFKVKSRDMRGEKVALCVSAVGYKAETRDIDVKSKTLPILNIRLEPKPIELRSIRVSPPQRKHTREKIVTREQVKRASQQSVVPTNPVSAIQQPQVVREGSSHSSRLWVNGTSPTYYVNGIEIGSNPNHFGMFSIIPAPVVSSLRLHEQGTPAQFGLPSAVSLETAAPLHKHAEGELRLSMIEATGSWSIGSERFFVLGALRKSVLDKLVEQTGESDGAAERQTIPPTNFQDLFVSSGAKLSNNVRLTVDQYHVRDFLVYNASASSRNRNGIETYLHTGEHYVSARLDALRDDILIQAGAAYRSSLEEYRTLAENAEVNGLELDLRTRQELARGSVELGLPVGENTVIRFGNQTEYLFYQDVDLLQKNWNFLPPDANSDNPFYYQPELNELYGNYAGSRDELTSSTYGGMEFSLGRWDFESGARWQYFDGLQENSSLLLRQRATLETGERSSLSLFAGTFAASPVGKIYEPYQVLIQAHSAELSPVKTALVSAEYKWGPVKFGLFGKQLGKQPVVAPDFEVVGKNGEVNQGFITVQSSGRSRFVGGDVALELSDLFDKRLDLFTYYGYTHSAKEVHGVVMPHELNAPHRFFVSADYKLSNTISLGTDLAVRSGYPYTPSLTDLYDLDADRYTATYYEHALSRENTARFPTHAALNLHVAFDFGDAELFLSTSNVTNRANPIISTADGFIYDAGILPSVGLVWGF